MTAEKVFFACLLILIAAVVIGPPKPHAPEWKDVCVKSHLTYIYYPTQIGKTTVMLSQPVEQCDQRRKTCVVPKNWKGKQQCPTLKN